MLLKIWHKIVYYTKQLFPCMYISTYTIDNIEFLSIWRQWFGHILWSETYELASETTIINSKTNTKSSSVDGECITFISKSMKGDDTIEKSTD